MRTTISPSPYALPELPLDEILMSSRQTSINSLLSFWDLEKRDIRGTLLEAPSLSSVAVRRDSGRRENLSAGKATAGGLLCRRRNLNCAFSHIDTGCGDKKATVHRPVHRPVHCTGFRDEGQNWHMDCGNSITLTQRHLSQSNHWTRRWQDFKMLKTNERKFKTNLDGYTSFKQGLQASAPELPKVRQAQGLERDRGVYQKRSNAGSKWSSSGVCEWRERSSIGRLESSPPRQETVTSAPTASPNSSLSAPVPFNFATLIERPHLIFPMTRMTRKTSQFARETDTPSLLLCLPEELILLILSFLKPSELAMCMLVCRTIYRLAVDPCLWKSVSITKTSNLSDEVMLNVSKRVSTRLKFVHSVGSVSNSVLHRSFGSMLALQELTIDACYIGPFTGDQLLICASTYCHYLSSVDIRWVELSDKALRLFSDNCMSLKKIGIESTPLVLIDTVYLLMLKHRARLTHIRIQGNLSFSAQDLLEMCVSKCITLPHVTSFICNRIANVEKFETVFPSLI